MAQANLIERLGKLDTCAVSDALDRLGLKGATYGVRPMWPCPKIVGRAVTMKIKPAGLDKAKHHLGTMPIEAAKAGDIIVVDNGGRLDTSCWGGLLALAAKSKGISGVAIDGACRDIDESRELGFPVYARGAVPMTARGRIMQESYNQEIEFAGVQVHPGDPVIADGSGVVVIPQAREEEVVREAEAVAATEARMAEGIRRGLSVLEVLESLGYESMLEKKKKG